MNKRISAPAGCRFSRIPVKGFFLLIACLLLWCHATHAQKVFVDSLTRAYHQNHQDTTLVQLYAEKAEKIYITSDPDSGMTCVTKGLELSQRIHYKHGELHMMVLKAIYLNRRGGLVESIKISFDVIPQAIKTNDERLLAQAYNNLGLCYQVLKNYHKSIDYYLLFIRVTERSNFYDYQVTAYNNTARVYFDVGNIDSASYYNNKAYSTAIRTKNVRNIAYLIRNFGTVATAKGDYKKAIDYFRKSIIVLKVKTNHYLLSEDNRRLAEAYLHLKRTDSALYFAKGAYDEGKLDKDPELIMKAADMLTSIYSSTGDYKNAYVYQQEKIVNGDSLFSREKSLQIQNLTFNEDQRRQKETAVRNAREARMRFYLLLGILGVVVLIVLILWYSNSARKRANQLLHEQKEEIAAQRDELENKNRDMHIEAALDRVRVRAMAMQNSEELSQLVATVITELSKLDVALSWCLITILDEATWSARVWRANSQADQAPQAYLLPFADYPFQNAIMRAWKEREEKWNYVLQGEEKKAIDEYMFTKTDYSKLPEHVQAGIRAAEPAYFYFSFSNFGGLQVGGPRQLTNESVDILARFGKVFDLTYTRFNDLKIAETNARRAVEDMTKLQAEKERTERALEELRKTQSQLIQAEKMASLGELTAGIAHEIQNPLNFVNNFSEVNREMLQELKAESRKPKAERDDQLEVELINDLIQNEEKINHHGKRADAIVKGMLQHSRTNTGEKQLTDMNVLCDEFLKLSYHGLRAKEKNFNAEMITHFDPKLPKVNVSQQDMGRVMLNLFNNAFYAVNQKLKTAGAGYKPAVEVTTFTPPSGGLGVTVKDNGIGIPDAIKEKIMQPFFTTKPTGEGTGLGLSLSYDMVVKGHSGNITVDTVEGEFTQFTIILPIT